MLLKIAAKTELDEDVVAEMRVSHVDDDSFSVELFNLRKVSSDLFFFLLVCSESSFLFFFPV
jgi:hypothetical protein